MTSKEDKVEITRRGVNAFGRVEVAGEEINAGMLELEQVYKDGADAGMAKATEILKTIQAFRRLSGQNAALLEEIYALHTRAAEIAKENDADVALPSGFAVTYGGGGR